MPLYEYLCSNCGQRFETRQSFKDNALTVCPNCGGKIHRVPQAAGVVFKGSGWYITDSKGKQNIATSGEKKTDSDSNGTPNGESSATPAAASTDSAAKPSDTSTSSAPAKESTPAPVKEAAPATKTA